MSYKAFRPYLKKFLAYYYNRSLEWNQEVCVYYKSDAVMYHCAIFDRERGQLDGVSPTIWQGETATSRNAWSYCTTNRFKTPQEIAGNLVEVIAKNGVFVLNIGPKADGTICDKEQHILKTLGEWTRKNEEGIWGTVPYKVVGEGKRRKNGSFNEKYRYGKADFRFTYKTGTIYAFALAPGGKTNFRIKSFAHSMDLFNFVIKKISVLGEDVAVSYQAKKNYMELTLSRPVKGNMPLCFKLEVD